MVRIKEKEIDSNYKRAYMNGLSYYKSKKNTPTHFTLTPGKDGFENVKYYRLDLIT